MVVVIRFKRIEKGELQMENMVKFTLASARVNAGYSQKKAAELLEISNKTLGAWEKYQSYPSADMIPKICDLYGIPYEQINFAHKSAFSGI